MHGTIMIFLFVVPVLSGFANYIVPLQLGAPDMAFPRINALSFWLLPLGGGLIFTGYLFGGAAAEGWTGYAPLSTGQYAQGVGTDLWLIGLVAGRHRLDPGLDQLHHHHLQDARAGHDAVPDADLRLDRAGHRRPDPARHAGADRRPDRALHRPQLRRPLLRPDAGRQSRSCGSTSSGSSATRRCTSSSCRPWAWSARSCRCSAASRCSGTGPSSSPRSASACSASASGRTTCSRPARCCLPFFAFMTSLIAVPTGRQDVQLVGDHVARQDQLHHADAVRLRLHDACS